MPGEKLPFLRQSHTLHPEGVRDSVFTGESPFFDPRDLVQANYELLPQPNFVPLPGDQHL